MSGKKYDDSWDSLLADLSGYLGGIFGKVRAWLSAEDTPDDAGFDDCWCDWVRLMKRRPMKRRSILLLPRFGLRRGGAIVTCWRPSMGCFSVG